MSDVVLQVEDLSIGFASEAEPGGTSGNAAVQTVTAITDRVNFELRRGEVLGLVGESGCGKTVTALALLRLLPSPGGRILGGRIQFQGRDILSLDHDDMRKLRGGEISMIFQEPSAALNPLMTIEGQLFEVFAYHDLSEAPGVQSPDKRVRELLARVGFADPDRILKSYPHQLSGGMLQRVVIAMALLLKPAIVIADEPTTALDVTVQAQIMELLVELQREEGTSVLLITHNLGLIAQYAERLAVMYAGRIVEDAPVESFLNRAHHPYSEGLLAALPDVTRQKRLQPIDGQVPRPADYDDGCRFRDRCHRRSEVQPLTQCEERPRLLPLEADAGREVACWLHAGAQAEPESTESSK
ncbi:MAG: ABC transporter ATP-binding protein [Leptospirales bacterium]|jgi:peptide/nickel transport system ATP-binding protein